MVVCFVGNFVFGVGFIVVKVLVHNDEVEYVFNCWDYEGGWGWFEDVDVKDLWKRDSS